MIVFLGSIEATAENYSKLAATGKTTIDQLTNLFQGINCPHHPFHPIHAQVLFSEENGTTITLTNSCCSHFVDLFDETITRAGIVLDNLQVTRAGA